MSIALLILPHQLFGEHPGFLEVSGPVVLFEDPLFFGDPIYPARFHKQKLWLHRATMAHYKRRLETDGHEVSLVSYKPDTRLIDGCLTDLATTGVEKVLVADPVDNIAQRRIERAAKAAELDLKILPTPGFINARADNRAWSDGRKRWFMADFYKRQRRRLDVLMDQGEPVGGQWSFDQANRKKVPLARIDSIPNLPKVTHDSIDLEARDSVLEQFKDAPGSIERLRMPTTHEAAALWLDDFLANRFREFGDFEDAIVEGENWLWHSVLTPALNIGLLTPEQVLKAALKYAQNHDVPINSLEGFVRQVIGWREFMRATYDDMGPTMRTTNHWNHHRKLPTSFYDGTTGIDPIDDVIGRVLDTGYCHHIERLMVLGGFMFICEIDPDEVYRWFMEMFIDSYDWVMVPNVYAMSQNADGGLITTKPYFSGSNYIRKMSHWKPGRWSEIWDGLYWRFIWNHRAELRGNPRWAMMCKSVENMDDAKRRTHIDNAEEFLATL
ncbi:cryptochrome/photolyase family protein [Rhodobacteraceae bacterium]|nr:cryptochrome/photolyase family protein [Paracoccaceae bacterium]